MQRYMCVFTYAVEYIIIFWSSVDVMSSPTYVFIYIYSLPETFIAVEIHRFSQEKYLQMQGFPEIFAV